MLVRTEARKYFQHRWVLTETGPISVSTCINAGPIKNRTRFLSSDSENPGMAGLFAQEELPISLANMGLTRSLETVMR